VVCVVRPDRSAYSQTFVDAHIRRLPATVKVLHGGYFPQFTEDDRPLLSAQARALAIVREKALGGSRRPLEHRALVRWLKREGVDVVLAEFGQTGAEIWEACAAAGVPLVVHFHGGDAVREKWRRLYGEAYRRMFDTVAGLVAVSRQTEEVLVALGAPPDRLVYNPCGADTTLFAPTDPAAAPPHFLAVNRFVDKKAPHLTILAFRDAVAACPGARLLMIGDGPLLEACRQLVGALRLEGAVEFLGAVPHADVAAAMGRVRALVLHSVTTSDGDVEGTPVSVLEAGAAALPVIATRHAGIADVVVDGETGLLVDERDVDGMAQHIISLMREPAQAAALGRRARERVTTHFSLDASIARLWVAIEAARRRGPVPVAAREVPALVEAGPRR
jgi:glycosyltransferase involved in cell wall biosynthesis